MGRSAVALCAFVAVAFADDAPRRLDVSVGQTVEREVGYAIGYRCDDLSIIDVEMKTKPSDTNVFIVTGRKVGSTLCRVGADGTERPTFLFDVRVTADKPRLGRSPK